MENVLIVPVNCCYQQLRLATSQVIGWPLTNTNSVTKGFSGHVNHRGCVCVCVCWLAGWFFCVHPPPFPFSFLFFLFGSTSNGWGLTGPPLNGRCSPEILRRRRRRHRKPPFLWPHRRRRHPTSKSGRASPCCGGAKRARCADFPTSLFEQKKEIPSQKTQWNTNTAHSNQSCVDSMLFLGSTWMKTLCYKQNGQKLMNGQC